ncbi:MAG: ABC transporter ATP-binding protein [Candidatus Peribacteraceae bacterium]
MDGTLLAVNGYMYAIVPKSMERKYRKLHELFCIMGVRFHQLAIPIVLSFTAAMCAVAGFGLLIPLARSLAARDISQMLDTPFLGNVLTIFARSPTEALSETALLVIAAGLFVALQLLRISLEYASFAFAHYWGGRYARNITLAMLRRYLRFGKLFFDRESQGEMRTTIMYSQEVLQLLISLRTLLNAGLQLLARLCIMLVISWKLTLIMACAFPLLFVCMRRIAVAMRRLSLHFRQKQMEFGRKLFNVFSAMTLVKTYTREQAMLEHFGALQTEIRSTWFRMRLLEESTKPIQEVIIVCFVTAMLFAGTFMQQAVLDAEQIAVLVVFLYVVIGTMPLYAQMGRMFGLAVETTGPVLQVLSVFNDEEKFIVPEGQEEFGGLRSGIAFRDVWFSYTEDVPVLQGVTFDVPKGSTVAIVGPSGSGKTTLVNLLLRLYDCAPSAIQLDGRDIRTLTHASLQKHIAYVTQEPLLFNESLRENLLFGMDNHLEDATLHSVLQQARLDDLISRLPAGMETVVGDRGIQLSGGEKQRLSIARAILKDAEIIVLDEATSSLDSQTERRIQEALELILQDRTAIIIAHRLSTIRNADKIVVIHAGQVAEEGTLSALLADEDGMFHRLWKAQQFY